MEREQVKSVIESLLFVADAPVSLGRFAEILDGVERQEIAAALDGLRADYESQARGIRLSEVAGGFQLRTPKEHADWVKRLYQGRPARMARATLETLAIVAYKQPVTRAEIEAVRGVDVDSALTTLLERRLIRIVARKDIPGRPYLYGTTVEFLEMFNLKDLSHLPTLKAMEEMALPEEVEQAEGTTEQG